MLFFRRVQIFHHPGVFLGVDFVPLQSGKAATRWAPSPVISRVMTYNLSYTG